MTLETAVSVLPTDKLAFNKVRYRWIKAVRGHPMLTSAQRAVGVAIAQEHINHNPESPWFHTAWAAHTTIAEETGLSRRTVISAMIALRQMGLIAVERGGGWKVAGGRTDRYTLRTDWLDVLEHAAQTVRRNDVKRFHRSNYPTASQFSQSREMRAESGEIGDQLMRNSPSEHVKELRPTLSNPNPLESLFTTLVGPPSFTPEPAARKRASNGRKNSLDHATEKELFEIASLLGSGNIENGYLRLLRLNEADANDLALRYRLDGLSGEAVRLEAARLEATPGCSE